MQSIEQARLRNLKNTIRKNGVKIRLLLAALVLILLYCSAMAGYAYGVASQVMSANSSYLMEIKRDLSSAEAEVRQYQAEVEEYEAKIAGIAEDIEALKADN